MSESRPLYPLCAKSAHQSTDSDWRVDRIDLFRICNPEELSADALLSDESWTVCAVPVRWLIPEINRAAAIPAFFELQSTDKRPAALMA